MFRIFGPPGTGKTTTLLNMVDKALEAGTPPQSIGFLAFTRKAANEAKERAAAQLLRDQMQAVHDELSAGNKDFAYSSADCRHVGLH